MDTKITAVLGLCGHMEFVMAVCGSMPVGLTSIIASVSIPQTLNPKTLASDEKGPQTTKKTKTLNPLGLKSHGGSPNPVPEARKRCIGTSSKEPLLEPLIQNLVNHPL